MNATQNNVGNVNIVSEGSIDQSSAICLAFSMGSWGTRRKIKKNKVVQLKAGEMFAALPTDEAAAVAIKADREMVGFSKKIMDCPELDAIRTYDSETKHLITLATLPSFFKRGVYLTPSATVPKLDQQIEARMVGREQLVSAFMEVYTQRRDEMPEKLRSLFDSNDYPDPERVRAEFWLSKRWFSIDVPQGLANISEAIWQAEMERAKEEWDKTLANLTAMMRVELNKMVSHLAEILGKPDPKTGKPRKLVPGAFTAITEFCDAFAARNTVLRDNDLAAVVDQIKATISGADAKALRDDDAMRAALAASMTSISQSVAGLVHTGGRAFDFDDEELG